MSQQYTFATVTENDFTRSRQLSEELDRCVHTLENRLGRTLDVRRVRADLDHLRESLALLQSATTGGTRPATAEQQQKVPISDAPYDPSLWRGESGDEGIGRTGLR